MRLQAAVGEGRLDLDEFGQRAGAAYAAVTTAEPDVLLADLPTDAAPRAEIVGTRVPDEVRSVFGDVVLSAGVSVPRQVSTVFGDVRIDLRGLRTDVDRIDLYLGTTFGDVDVIVAEGVAAELHGRTVFSDRKVELAPVRRLTGPRWSSCTGARSSGTCGCAAWRPASRWRALLDRLAER